MPPQHARASACLGLLVYFFSHSSLPPQRERSMQHCRSASSVPAHSSRAVVQKSRASHLMLKPKAGTPRVSSCWAASKGSTCRVGASCCLQRNEKLVLAPNLIIQLAVRVIRLSRHSKTSGNRFDVHSQRMIPNVTTQKLAKWLSGIEPLHQVADWRKILGGLREAGKRSFQAAFCFKD